MHESHGLGSGRRGDLMAVASRPLQRRPRRNNLYFTKDSILNQESRKWDFRDRRKSCEGSSERVGR